VQALLKRYERESPSILREDEVKRAISNFRTKSDLMAIQSVRSRENNELANEATP
jgi:hypothetical protein